MLAIRHLKVAYGITEVLRDVSFEVPQGRIVALLGGNGSGKTTMLNTLTGLVKPVAGSIQFEGKDCAGLPPHEIVRAGIAQVPQGREVWPGMSVHDNLELGAATRRDWPAIRSDLDDVYAMFPKLADRKRRHAGSLSGGEQQMVAIGRALMARPRCLLMDEPSLGLSPLLVRELFSALRQVRETGVGLLMVEQNARESLALADRGYLIENGRIVGGGTAQALQSDPAVRRAYLGGIETGAKPGNHGGKVAMNKINLLLENQDVEAIDGITFERLNPMTGEVATRAAAAKIVDVRRAADAAAAAFPAWSATGPSARRMILLKAADVLASKAPQFIELMAAETGSTAGWAGFNVHLAVGMLREAAAMTTQISGEVIPSKQAGMHRGDTPTGRGRAQHRALECSGDPRRPRDRDAAGLRQHGGPEGLGDLSRCTHMLIAECLRESGLPPGVVNVLTNALRRRAGQRVIGALISHNAVRRVNFTGSTRVGQIVAPTAAQYLKPALLELGGKASLMVLEDADLDAAVKAAAFGAFMNQGQICMSTERIMVDNKVADAFVAKLHAKGRSTGGRRSAQGPHSARLPRRCHSGHHDPAPDQGRVTGKIARIVAGGKVEGTLMSATVVSQVTPSMRIYSEEIFGPVVAIVRVNGVEARPSRIANDTEYGLAGRGVRPRHRRRPLDVARRIQSGICHVNGPTVHDEAQMPFGGVKASGYGRFGGKAGIAEFTELRWITIETGPQHYPI